MTGAAVETGTTLRLCETEGCDTKLSRFNSRPICAACEARLEIGGAVIPLPRQPRFAPRPPAPERPTTEGGITLPGIVKGRERSYEDMIAKPAAVHKPADTANLETPQTRIPPRAHEDSKADSKAPAKPSQKRTAPRKFDWEDAARRYQAGETQQSIADDLGVSQRTVSTAVRTVLGAEVGARLSAKKRGWRSSKDAPTVAPATPPSDTPATPADRRSELARLAAELDDIHNQQTRLYARWRVTAERYAELLRDDA